MFANFLREFKTFNEVNDTETIVIFLDTKQINKEEDPEQKWITT
jgi:hypothetical protein